MSRPTLHDRVADLRRLRGAGREAVAGCSRLVPLAGEAGIGKSRLTRGLALEVEGPIVVILSLLAGGGLAAAASR